MTVFPTFDLFYRGNRVARVEGGSYAEVEELLERYQFQNSKLDLFSEHAVEPWGDRKVKDPNRTPRTTARFIPGYDWNKDKGFFDDVAGKSFSLRVIPLLAFHLFLLLTSFLQTRCKTISSANSRIGCQILMTNKNDRSSSPALDA